MLRIARRIGAEASLTARSAVLSALVVGAVALATWSVGSLSFSLRITTIVVYLVVVVGSYVFIGNSGVISFGHVAFMAIGAYAFALMTVPPSLKHVLLSGLPVWVQHLNVEVLPATVIAGLLASLFALAIGWPLVRLSGLAASIALFAVLLVVNVVISEATSITRGQEGIVGVPLTTSTGSALVSAILVIFLAGLFQESASGLRLRYSREDEFAAEAIGVNITRHRLLALTLSAFIVGIGGALYAGLIGVLTPQEFYIQTTFTTVVMLVVGGIRSLTGAVVGTATIFSVSEVLRLVEGGFTFGPLYIPSRPGLQLVGIGLLGLVIMIGRPRGITGGRELNVPTRANIRAIVMRVTRKRPRGNVAR